MYLLQISSAQRGVDITIGLLIGIACAIACGIIAKRKNRHVGDWVVLGFIFNIPALIILLFLSKKQNKIE